MYLTPAYLHTTSPTATSNILLEINVCFMVVRFESYLTGVGRDTPVCIRNHQWLLARPIESFEHLVKRLSRRNCVERFNSALLSDPGAYPTA
jgi:hypothetical protein